MITTLAVVLFALLLSPVRGEDWPQFLGPQSNGISTETGLLESWPADGPPLLWEKEIGTGYSAPSVLNGKLVLHHRIADEEIVECFDAVSAKPVWRYAYPSHFIDPFGYNNGPRSAPLLTNKLCYTFGAEGKLLCLNLQTGKLVWERDTGKEWNVPEAFFGVGSSPVLESGLLLVMVGGQPNSGMVAFDPLTGETVWESVGQKNWEGQRMTGWRGEPPVRWRAWDKQASYATPIAANIHGKRHVLCLMRQGLVSLDPKSGEVHFSFWFRAQVNESVNAATPVVAGDRILISGAYYRIGSVLLEIQPDHRSVKERWRSTALEMHWSTPIYHKGYLYGFSGRNEPDARFRCVEFESGKVMWDQDESWHRFRKDSPQKYGRGSCILADGKLIALGETGLLGLFDPSPEEPKELARYKVPQLEYPCWASPILANKMLYLRSEKYLLCYDLSPP